VASNLGASATVGGLCHAAERHIRWAANVTIQDLGSLGEFIAAIATVATLAYLAVQIRQSNVTARAQSRQTMIDTWSSTNWDLARDPRMLKAFAAGLSRWPDISNEDKTTFDMGMGK